MRRLLLLLLILTSATLARDDYPPDWKEATSDPKLMECLVCLNHTSLALTMYAMDFKKLPSPLDKLAPEYLKKLFVCPTGAAYVYQQVDPNGFKLTCSGSHPGVPKGYPNVSYTGQELLVWPEGHKKLKISVRPAVNLDIIVPDM